MNPFIYTRIPIFLFGWIGLIIFTLSYRFEEDKLDNINLKSLPNNKPDNCYMAAEEEKPLSEMQAYVTHLRYRLAWYQFYRILPPAKILVELKMAQRLVELELKDGRHIDVKI